jgi:hypothetical protein
MAATTKIMKLLPRIPLGEETKNGFRVVEDDPSRDYSFMDETRARIIRERWFIAILSVLTLAAGLIYYFLVK